MPVKIENIKLSIPAIFSPMSVVTDLPYKN